MIPRLEAAGAKCAVVHGIEEAVAQLREWGLLDETKPAGRMTAAQYREMFA